MVNHSPIRFARAVVKGKFLYIGDRKFYIKGTTYGTFAPDSNGLQFPPKEVVENDFSLMAEYGFNTIRTYTVPPEYILDLALEYELKVMIGLPWEQHITFLDSDDVKKEIISKVEKDVIACKQHPAILCYAIGNEIPAPIVRWYGKRKIENFLRKLYTSVKKHDPYSLVTYVNYPTTEYLNLDFLDFDCFNVYLETPEKLGAYILRLHNLSRDRPLVLAEIGLDSIRNGIEKQAEVLNWQVETIFGKGCAGMFVFAWTDEWWRGGFDITDWDFGMVDRERNPKPALHAVSIAMHGIPIPSDDLPFITVAICSYNGSATVRDTLEALQKLDYPKFEVIVVNDGSKDNFAEIVSEYPVQLISTENRGLSNARNTAMNHARGEIVAYLDDDAYPDPQWLKYLAYAYRTTNHAGIGGPNIAPEEDGPIAHCVANAPGGPVHVLTSDEIAEHIPGCNMSFRREALLKVGGCDPIYRTAGDDVDLCWRIQAAGFTIGYHPAALVWHHRRNSLKAYWKQQKGYGKAEALLESKWPEKYNGLGHLAWSGRIYGNGWTLPIKTKRKKIFHGSWGSALFQSVYEPADGLINRLPLMPEWFLLSAILGIASILGFSWPPLYWMAFPFAVTLLVVIVQSYYSASKNTSLPTRYRKFKYKMLIGLLHMIQPVARLYGRVKFGLTPWRQRGAGWSWKYLLVVKPKVFLHWSEQWKSHQAWLTEIEQNLLGQRSIIRRGGDFDSWDIQTGNTLFASVKCLLAVEEHGASKQYIKVRTNIRYGIVTLICMALVAILAIEAFVHDYWMSGTLLSIIVMAVLWKCLIEKSNALNSLELSVRKLSTPSSIVTHIHNGTDIRKNEKTNKTAALKLKAKDGNKVFEPLD